MGMGDEGERDWCVHSRMDIGCDHFAMAMSVVDQ